MGPKKKQKNKTNNSITPMLYIYIYECQRISSDILNEQWMSPHSETKNEIHKQYIFHVFSKSLIAAEVNI